jgi:hypothetical protein
MLILDLRKTLTGFSRGPNWGVVDDACLVIGELLAVGVRSMRAACLKAENGPTASFPLGNLHEDAAFRYPTTT